MVDTWIQNSYNECIDCRACSAICPERSIYINRFEYEERDIRYFAHFRKEKQYCEKCIKENGEAPCVEICPENALEIISE